MFSFTGNRVATARLRGRAHDRHLISTHNVTLMLLAVANVVLGTHDLSGVFTMAQEIRKHRDNAIWVGQYVSAFCLGLQLNLCTPGCRSPHVGGLLDQKRRIALNGLKFNSARRQEFEIQDVAGKANQATYASHLASPRARG